MAVNERSDVRVTGVTPAEDVRTVVLNQVSWGAVFAGIALALVVHLLLTMIGAGVGLISLNPGQAGAADAGTFSITAGIWWIVAGIIAAFAGGYTAGRLSGRPKQSTAAWHGLASWAGTTIIVFYLLTTAVAGIVGGVFNAVGSFAQTAAEVAAPVVDELDPLEQVAQQVEIAAPGDDAAAIRDAAVAAVRAALTADEAEAAEAQETAAQALARATGEPIETAQQRLANLQADFEAAMAEAADAAEAASNALGTASLFAALALVLGAIAAWFGGRMGKVRPTVTV